MNTFLTWLKLIPTVLQTVIATVAALEAGFKEVATATGSNAAGTGATKLDVVKAALESLYATEQSLVSVVSLDKLTSFVSSVTSTIVNTFNKLGWFQKSAATTGVAR